MTLLLASLATAPLPELPVMWLRARSVREPPDFDERSDAAALYPLLMEGSLEYKAS